MRRIIQGITIFFLVACAFRIYTVARSEPGVDDKPRPASVKSSIHRLPVFIHAMDTVEESRALCADLGMPGVRAGCSKWRYRLRELDGRLMFGWAFIVYPKSPRWAHVRKHERDHVDCLCNWHRK